MTFTQRYDKHIHNKTLKCPKCKSPLILIHGAGIDYDREWCSSRDGCDYDVEYETTTDVNECEIK